MIEPAYTPLWCKSNYSFLEGASHPDELVEEAERLGLGSLALTDRDGVYGAVRAHVKARETGLRLIHGAQTTIDDGSTIVLLAADRDGYANLCRLLTAGRRRSPKGESRVAWREVAEHAPGLLALWGGEASLLAQEADPAPVAALLREAFGDRLYAMVARHRRAEDLALETRTIARAQKWGLPLVAARETLYHNSARRPLQDVLTCIRHGVTLAGAGRKTKPNAEYALLSPYAFRALYADLPDAVDRTREIAARCKFSLDQIRYRYPAERLPDGMSSHEWLRQLTFAGAAERYPEGVPADVAAQLERELALIDELDYGGYFLTMWEIIQFCREREILCQGRGSAANSAVCYCLGITAIDPVRMGLLFERFLSRERAEPPDIDLDIMHERREEVIQHMYEKYGRDRAAMVANFIRYRGRMAVRDVGKVLGLPVTTLTRLAKLAPGYGELTAEHLRLAGLDPEAQDHRLLLALCAEIQGFPRHLSIHPGGFLLGDAPVHDLVPIENGTMPGRTVIQWDKEDVEDLGLFKVDLLGLGALTHLDRTFRLLARRGVALSMATIPPDDPATYDMVSHGDTVGMFQIESRAQMSMLPRLRPRNFYDLVIEISIIRPGPITGGMVHPYLRRRNGEETVEYPHESLRPVLEKTLGVPLFQEQVMKLAVVAADYTPGEADQLRRDMAAWRRGGRIGRHRDRLLSRMKAKGIAEEFAERVFQQIQGFGEYGFPESHAASFALIGYATAYLKRHYPDEFVCGLLNAQPMGFYTPATIIEDAKRHDVVVLPASVIASEWDCTLERITNYELRITNPQSPVPSPQSPEPGTRNPEPGTRTAVRVGLRYVKGLGVGDYEKIAAAGAAAPFASVDDFVQRTDLSTDAVAVLVEGGALEELLAARRAALWQALGAARDRDPAGAQYGMTAPALREQSAAFAALSDFETILWDYRAQGLSARAHPLSTVRGELRAQRLPTAAEVRAMPHGRRVRYAGLVICRQRPGTAAGVVFLTLEDETGFVNVIVWPKIYTQFLTTIKLSPILGVVGKLQVEGEVRHLIAESLWRPAISLSGAHAASRDFH